MVIQATDRPREQLTLLFTTEQLARIAEAAAREDKTLEQFITERLGLDPEKAVAA